MIYQWAKDWGIPEEAVLDYLNRVNALVAPTAPGNYTSEQAASKQVALAAAQQGDVLWRNNVGQVDPTSYDGKSFIRFGLANDTKQMNKIIKSSDRIGIRQVRITPAHVGLIIGQFTAREVKHPGWQYRGTEREVAQLRYIDLVNSMGGDAKFTTGEY